MAEILQLLSQYVPLFYMDAITYSGRSPVAGIGNLNKVKDLVGPFPLHILI